MCVCVCCQKGHKNIALHIVNSMSYLCHSLTVCRLPVVADLAAAAAAAVVSGRLGL